MIRRLHPLDVARYALLGGPGGNRAHTLDSLGREARQRLSVTDVSRLSVSLRRRGVCSLVWTRANRAVGIAAARPRSGERTWEASHLYLTSKDDALTQDLMRALAQSVARRQGERIFARFAYGDPLIEVAGLCGFAPSGHEYLYRGRRRSAGAGAGIDVRRTTPADEYGIFQLYTACTPSDRRLSSGMTFGQWSDSRERVRRRGHEFVFTKDGQVRGWINTIRGSGPGMVQLMVHPDDESDVDGTLDFGLARLPRGDEVYCLVSDHQSALIGHMRQRGFEVQSEYVTLVRSMVTPVLDGERMIMLVRRWTER